MDRTKTISKFKRMLLQDVAYLCRRIDLKWSGPISQTLREIRSKDIGAVFFGGTLRSLLLSRLRKRAVGRPRDIDIVISGSSVERLRTYFSTFVSRETRFGGIQLMRDNWQFDMWPLDRTWAFRKQAKECPQFSDLPFTTFFNLEAIAVDVWAKPGRRRAVYSGNEQFFDGILNQTIELNFEQNPYPSLCVVRALALAYSTGFYIGPRLARYLVEEGSNLSESQVRKVQRKHYGLVRLDMPVVQNSIDHIAKQLAHNEESSVRMPVPRQLELWPSRREPYCVRLHLLGDD